MAKIDWGLGGYVPAESDGKPSKVSQALKKVQELGAAPVKKAHVPGRFDKFKAELADQNAGFVKTGPPGESLGHRIKKGVTELNAAPAPQGEREPTAADIVWTHAAQRGRDETAKAGISLIDQAIAGIFSAPTPPEPSDEPSLLARGLKGGANLAGRGLKAGAGLLGRGIKAGAGYAWKKATEPRPSTGTVNTDNHPNVQPYVRITNPRPILTAKPDSVVPTGGRPLLIDPRRPAPASSSTPPRLTGPSEGGGSKPIIIDSKFVK